MKNSYEFPLKYCFITKNINLLKHCNNKLLLELLFLLLYNLNVQNLNIILIKIRIVRQINITLLYLTIPILNKKTKINTQKIPLLFNLNSF